MSLRICLQIRCRMSCRSRWSRLRHRSSFRLSHWLRMKTRLLCWPGRRKHHLRLHGCSCLHPPQVLSAHSK